MALQFTKAIKRDAKLRLAICGPAGSGKTFTLLKLATELAGPNGKVAGVDTEHGSASKYAHTDKCATGCVDPGSHFDFDVAEPDTFDPRELIQAIKDAVKAGYKVFFADSLSHYWMGKGGELDLVDAAAKKTKDNSFAAWKSVTPIHAELVDLILSADIHILVSMRTKTEWVIEKNEQGKNAPRKIGMAPVMRDGIEFEFDVCGDMDQDNNLVITKSRCSKLAGKVINRPGKEVADTLREWCAGAPVEPKAATVAPAPVPASAPQAAPPARPAASGADKPWKTFKEMLSCFADMKGLVGEETYYLTMAAAGVRHANEFREARKALDCYAVLVEANERIKKALEAA